MELKRYVSADEIRAMLLKSTVHTHSCSQILDRSLTDGHVIKIPLNQSQTRNHDTIPLVTIRRSKR